jgi:hypothetical protein
MLDDAFNVQSILQGDVIADLRKKIANTDPVPKQINSLSVALALPFCQSGEGDD